MCQNIFQYREIKETCGACVMVTTKSKKKKCVPAFFSIEN